MNEAPPNTQLYLAATSPFLDEKAISCFESVIDHFHPAAFRIDFVDKAQSRRQCDAIHARCADIGIALMLTDWVDGVALLGCDGVHISSHTFPIAEIKKKLISDTQLGVSCGGSRDAAMQAGEAGADYVAIDADQTELAAWWMEMAELPLVCENIKTARETEELISLGVDFLFLRLDFNASFSDLRAQLAALGIKGR